MKYLTVLMIFISMALSAAIFGFFYAWVCSTMWGLDAAAPDVAIRAMQAMNASVRNSVFAPAFFGTPFALAFTAFLLWRRGFGRSAAAFAASAGVYFFCAMLLTITINVPMNLALAEVVVPDDPEAARAIWLAYSGDWQFWNQTRTVTSGISFLLAVSGLLLMKDRKAGNATA